MKPNIFRSIKVAFLQIFGKRHKKYSIISKIIGIIIIIFAWPILIIYAACVDYKFDKRHYDPLITTNEATK